MKAYMSAAAVVHGLELHNQAIAYALPYVRFNQKRADKKLGDKCCRELKAIGQRWIQEKRKCSQR